MDFSGSSISGNRFGRRRSSAMELAATIGGMNMVDPDDSETLLGHGVGGGAEMTSVDSSVGSDVLLHRDHNDASTRSSPGVATITTNGRYMTHEEESENKDHASPSSPVQRVSRSFQNQLHHPEHVHVHHHSRHEEEPAYGMRDPLFPAWTSLTLGLHSFFAKSVAFFAGHAVQNPKSYLTVITLLAFTLQAVGFFVGFEMVLDLDVVFTPAGSLPERHFEWIASPQGFPNEPRHVQMIFHNNGSNVLHPPQTRRVLQAIETVRTTPGYDELCSQGVYVNFEGQRTCRIMSISAYWEDHSLQAFDLQVGTSNDVPKLRQIISGKEFQDTSPVLHDIIVGNYARNNSTRILESAQSYMVQVYLPDKDDTDKFESTMLSNLADLRYDWMAQDKGKPTEDPSVLTVDIMTVYAFQLEIIRSILGDIPLVVICIAMMIGFVSLIFYRHNDPVHSRAFLGLASVVTICMSVMTGNGIMFLAGVPYSAAHAMLPFVIFGIGLDDTFIITGAYFRTNPQTTPIEERIRNTMMEVGPSITLTTCTTVFAFLLGYLTSSLPGVHWLCLYAMVIISLDFFFQITYFIAFLVLDERRMEAGRRDCCWWIEVDPQEGKGQGLCHEIVPKEHQSDSGESDDRPVSTSMESTAEGSNATSSVQHTPNGSTNMSMDTSLDNDDNNTQGVDVDAIMAQDEATAAAAAEAFRNHTTAKAPRELGIPDRIMRWYSEFLMKPTVKVIVMMVFLAWFGINCYSATQLEQDFNVADYVATDSYLAGVFDSLDKYSTVTRPMLVYFRDVDQMDPEIQRQMIEFVDELEALPQLGGMSASNATPTVEELTNTDEIRPFCWVRDIQMIDTYYANNTQMLELLQGLTFAQKLNFAMAQPVFREVYGQDIVIDEESGNITGSRCYLFLKNLDLKSVEAQINMLKDQRAVSKRQPINNEPAHKKDWAFFSFETLFFYWEAYAVAVDELVQTIIVGVIAVTVIAAVFIPHWSATCFVLPMIMVLYINMLGTIRFFGLAINGLTYLCIVVAIGLLVDFVMHVLLRYYESRPDQSREERVKETLQTMGVSILIGGFTTFLSVVPLAFSSMKIFHTVFFAFFSMVLLGCTHGLILMPVILSYVGPTMAVRGHHLAPKPDFPVSSSTTATATRRSSASVRRISAQDGTMVIPAFETPETIQVDHDHDLYDGDDWMRNVTDEIEV